MTEMKGRGWGTWVELFDAAMDMDRGGPGADPFLLDIEINKTAGPNR